MRMTAVPVARLAYVNVFSRDPERLASFYTALFGFAEIAGHRSPIYRCLDAGGVELGFNADKAYDLLGLGDRRTRGDRTVSVYATFEVASSAAVDALAARAAELGGDILKSPYDTYYNARQAVLADREGNVFRVNHRLAPRRPAAEIEEPPWA
jgi:predicted enzyme related to lactoylglutathione lyase